MSRDRYAFLLRNLYFSEVQSEKSNRLTKISELRDKLCSSFANCLSPFRNLCIDESLLLYKGCLSFKQYIPHKRHRFGIKSFVLCDCKTGFVLNFVVYADSDSDVTKMDDKYLGKSAEVVLTLLKSYLGKGHTLFVDNWYTSPTLFNYLYNNKTNVCGTVKPRTKDMPVLSEKVLPTCHSADYVTRKKNKLSDRRKGTKTIMHCRLLYQYGSSR